MIGDNALSRGGSEIPYTSLKEIVELRLRR